MGAQTSSMLLVAAQPANSVAVVTPDWSTGAPRDTRSLAQDSPVVWKGVCFEAVVVSSSVPKNAKWFRPHPTAGLYLLVTAALEFSQTLLERDVVAVIGDVMDPLAVCFQEVSENRRS